MRDLRNKDPDIYRLVTIRTQGAELLLLPNAQVRKLIGGILARYQEFFGIEIYAYAILGNHIHIVLRAPDSNTDEFFENVNREISRRLNWRLRREGKFWGRRYCDQEILSEDDLLEAFLYVNTNPARHGLIEDSSQWPGLISYNHVLSEAPKRYSFTQYSFAEPLVTTHRLKISPLPQFKSLKRSCRIKKIRCLLEERQKEIAKERRSEGAGFLGLELLRQQRAGDKPRNISRSNKSACYSKKPELIRGYREALRHRKAQYAEASMRYRLGLKADFPCHSFFPPLHRLPRLKPFSPITPQDLEC
ncbi:MAG: transposase [Bdellovibrionales bacterium]|nr:transposase [Bdellovibrionales bacterium]